MSARDPFAPPDPFGDGEDLGLSVEGEGRFVLQAKPGPAAAERAPAPPASGPATKAEKQIELPADGHGDEGPSYAEKQHALRLQYWTLTRFPVLLLLGWFTLSHVALDAQWVFIDNVNLVFHEAGHPLLRWAGDTIYFLGGTIGQLAWPFGLALYFFFKRRERFAATACVWWLGENFVGIARYMHDAPVEELPLVGGDTHDWNYLFSKWDMLRQARDIADVVRAFGIVIMLATLAYMVYMTLRPTSKELAAGFTA